MKTSLYLFICIIIFAFVINACKSVDIVNHNPNFQGKWNAAKTDTSWYIEINAQSEIFYQMVTGVKTEKYTGIGKYRKNKLSIGLNTFKINQEPSTVKPNEFILNGTTFKKSE